MEWFIDAYGDSFVVAPTAADARSQGQPEQAHACSSVFTFPMHARKKGCAPPSPRGSGGLDEPLLAADGTCAIYVGDRIVTQPESPASSSAQQQQPAKRQQPNRALCALWGPSDVNDMVVTVVAKGAAASSAPSDKLGLQPRSPELQRDTLPPARDQAPVASPSGAVPPPPAASKSFSYSQSHPMQDSFAGGSGGSGQQLRSFSSMQGRTGFGSGGGAPPAGGAAPGASGGLQGSGSQLHAWASTEWWRNMSSSRLNEMADAEDPRSPEMRKIPYVGGAAPMCALCHGDGDGSADREEQQVAAVLQQQL
ncbi:hypothetical protein CHLRE_01g028300v5 [Chlamydomonas reinhardtii]|uniref:Uncharacterized protein n=1 Tax=Chlamydomonas reinhardtii TaxID=3055 RepID=A0A2K3E6L9_CHLRE|nr:uncharacterized protein CHLRE_01g028300v5 [Chlamydomonas reinhardtii]PNW88413.1 hypothetical protein CHLRE_01g028300v5 [Chlamydomonas reinhardtii]